MSGQRTVDTAIVQRCRVPWKVYKCSGYKSGLNQRLHWYVLCVRSMGGALGPPIVYQRGASYTILHWWGIKKRLFNIPEDNFYLVLIWISQRNPWLYRCMSKSKLQCLNLFHSQIFCTTNHYSSCCLMDICADMLPYQGACTVFVESLSCQPKKWLLLATGWRSFMKLRAYH